MKLDPTKKYRYKPGSNSVYDVLHIVVVDESSPHGVILVCKDNDRDFPGLIVRSSIAGTYDGRQVVFEVSPYEGWEIDTPVIIECNYTVPRRRHYAGLDDEGRPTYWSEGATSWSASAGQNSRQPVLDLETIKRVEEE